MAYAPAWSALFMGLFLIATAIGELRRPGMWHGMIEEIERSPALQMVAGLLELGLGAAIYLACRGGSGFWPGDWLALAMMAVAGLMVAEALIVMAFSDIYIRFWMRKLGTKTRGWALFVLILGAALCAVALARFY